MRTALLFSAGRVKKTANLAVIAVFLCCSNALFGALKPGHRSGRVSKPYDAGADARFKKAREASIPRSIKNANLLPLPAISYNGPQVYAALQPIAALTPTSSFVSAPGYNSIPVNVFNSTYTILNVATDAAGNVYATKGNNAIEKIPADGSPTITIGAGSGIISPYGIAVDAAGNVYVSDMGDNMVKKLPAGQSIATTIATGFSYPTGIAVDAAGNVFVADAGDNSVKKIPAAGGEAIRINSSVNLPYGIAVDAAGNVFVAEYGNGMVEEIPADYSPIVTIISGIYAAKGVSVDAIGNVYVAAWGTGNITEVPAGGGTPVNIGSGFNQPSGVAIDAKGNVFVADYYNHTVKKIKPSGGYFINTALPAGLKLNPATGIISGTATVASTAKNYTITAYNGSGSGTAGVNITVNPPPLPSVSYSGPQTYKVSNPVSLAPAASNVGAFGYGAPVVLGAKHLTNFLAVDAAGNVYATTTAEIIEKIPPGGAPADINTLPGITKSYGIATDAQGNIYVADNGDKTVKKMPVGGGSPITLASGFSFLEGLAIDAAGNLYVADLGANSVKKIPAGGGSPIVIGSGFNQPVGIAVDGLGNVLVADKGNNAIKKIPAGGGTPVSLAPGFAAPYGVAVDGDGNVFVTDNYKVNMIPAGSTTAIIIGEAFKQPSGITVDSKGNVFVNDLFNIDELKAAGGYFISPQLPQGLGINPATGIISGTPLVSAALKTYTVYGCNFVGSTPATISIAVSPLGISYSSPQSYLAGTAIAPLSPGSGAAPQVYSASTVTLLTYANSVNNVAFDASGNIYTTTGDNLVKRIPAGGGAAVTIGAGSGILNPYGIAIDAAGNIYISDLGDNTVKKLAPGSASAVTIGSGFSAPRSLAVDAAGNVFVADYGHNAVKEIVLGGAIITVGSGFNLPADVAVDGAGNVYVADYGNNAIKEVPVGGGAIVTLGSNFSSPLGVAVDGAGDLFIADYGNNAIKEIRTGNNSPVIVGSGFVHPTDVVVAGSGNVFVADNGNKQVKQLKPASGYFINTLLPRGLNFDSSSGIISGTPTAASPATNYTVTAWYNSARASGNVSINVYLPPPVTLSYSSPQTWLANNYITPLVPVSGNVAPPNYSSPASLVSKHLTSYLALDPLGNIYATTTAELLEKVPPGGGSSTDINTLPGITKSYGIAIDAAGNIYVADNGDNTVKKMPVGGGSPVTIASGFSFLEGLAIDGAGNIYVVDLGSNSVKKIPAGGGTPVVIGSGLNQPMGVAVDAAGNVFVADGNNNAIKKFTTAGGTITMASGFQKPSGVAADASGNLFVTDAGGLKMIPVGSTTPVLVSAAFKAASGVATDAAGNIFVIDFFDIKQLKPTGGYFINTALPAGLYMDKATGIIIGAPTAVSSAKNYVITAYNFLGGVSTTVNIKVDALSISYNGPDTYYTGNAITPLAPTSSGVGSPGYLLYPATLKTGFSQPFGIAVHAGNVYVADRGNNTINKIPPGGGPMVTIGSGFSLPAGIATDISGNVYIADQGNNAIKMIPVRGIGIVTKGSGFSGPLGVAVDAAGNVYVADSGNGLVKKIAINNGAVSTLGSGFSHPNAVATDASGNVYVSDGGDNTLKMIPAGGSPVVTLASGLNQPYGIAVDNAGNVYFSDNGSNAVKEIRKNSSDIIVLGSGFHGPNGLAIDGAGNLYVADEFHGAAKKIVPAGGYFINAALPAGLTFDSFSGAISGTPAAVKAAANYTVIAYNSFGGNSAIVNIGVAANSRLSHLALSNGTLSPVFDAGTASYAAKVSYATKSITVTPTTSDAAATVTVNGVAVPSGTASSGIALNTGPNTINVMVTAVDGLTTETYTIVVTRALSSNAFLSTLKINSGTLTPAFYYTTTAYTTTVAPATLSIKVTPAAADVNAAIQVNGTAVTSGTASAAIPLAVGQNTISTVVTAQDGTTDTYTIVVTRLSNNAYLGSLKINNGTIPLSPAFVYTTTDYTASVTNLTTSVTITPTVAQAAAMVTVNGIKVDSKTASPPIALNVGPNTINTVVTAQDGTTTKTYTITITRTAPMHADNEVYQPIGVEKPIEGLHPEIDGVTVRQGVSPNGDGVNDVLLVDGITNYPDNRLMIMNRSGVLVYEMKGYDNSLKVFDGHSNKTGALQLPGTYFYSLDYTIKGVSKHKTGFIVLKY